LLDRFEFQRKHVSYTSGLVLNVGSYNDPANLKSIDRSRVLNCDINSWDGVDIVFDMRDKWPFESDSVELVILGDIIEHLFYPEALGSLTEARRVSQKLAITVPEDDRHEGTKEYPQDEAGARWHCYTWTEERLKRVLEETGWEIKDWMEVDYNFVPRGFFIYSERNRSPYI